MSKSNPLFVDSTRPHGDSIGTHVELRNVLVYDDENLVLVVTNHQGVSMRVAMRLADNYTYEARVHLNHQKSIVYQFVIEKSGEVVLSSARRHARAQYAIIEDWAPAPESPLTVPPKTTADPVPDANAWPGEYARSVKSLIEKWGL